MLGGVSGSKASKKWLNAMLDAEGSQPPIRQNDCDVIPDTIQDNEVSFLRPNPRATYIPSKSMFTDTIDKPIDSREWKIEAYKSAIRRKLPLVDKCSFIQNGLCHLCSCSTVMLVANVCPHFDFSHSICLMHLESLTSKSLSQVTQGNTIPCPICTHSACSCAVCDRLLQQQVDNYDKWLGKKVSINNQTIVPPNNPTSSSLSLGLASTLSVRTMNTGVGTLDVPLVPAASPVAPKSAAKATSQRPMQAKKFANSFGAESEEMLRNEDPMFVAESKELPSVVSREYSFGLPPAASFAGLVHAHKQRKFTDEDAKQVAPTRFINETTSLPIENGSGVLSITVPARTSLLGISNGESKSPVFPRAAAKSTQATDFVHGYANSVPFGTVPTTDQRFDVLSLASEEKTQKVIPRAAAKSMRIAVTAPLDADSKEIKSTPRIAAKEMQRSASDIEYTDSNQPAGNRISIHIDSEPKQTKLHRRVAVKETQKSAEEIPILNAPEKIASIPSTLEVHTPKETALLAISTVESESLNEEVSSTDSSEKFPNTTTQPTETNAVVAAKRAPEILPQNQTKVVDPSPGMELTSASTPENDTVEKTSEKGKSKSTEGATKSANPKASQKEEPVAVNKASHSRSVDTLTNDETIRTLISNSTENESTTKSIHVDDLSRDTSDSEKDEVDTSKTEKLELKKLKKKKLNNEKELKQRANRNSGTIKSIPQEEENLIEQIKTRNKRSKDLIKSNEIIETKELIKKSENKSIEKLNEKNTKRGRISKLTPPTSPKKSGKKIKKNNIQEKKTRKQFLSISESEILSKRSRGIKTETSHDVIIPETIKKTLENRKNKRNGDNLTIEKGIKRSKKKSLKIKNKKKSDEDVDTNLDYCNICKEDGDLVCCDTCPCSYHLICIKINENDLPHGDWQCNECKLNSNEIYFNSLKKELSNLHNKNQFMNCLLNGLISHTFSKPFLYPVENVDGYDDIVIERMDLMTVKERLENQIYYDRGIILHRDYLRDIRLIWYNCRLFNDEKSGLARAAKILSLGFEQIIKETPIKF